ncbi:hypothetical protein EW146_g4398 [Bondarzewia mesenterica]|uniref:Uncharacterized protein n=1 Tax=Bondarzewia mesenterica TaxID=1095465 RepID=A0A4V3XF51_9AGAM|nr:hypothetical protein EW146_g4398 [Bondarzewia mesenterica]
MSSSGPSVSPISTLTDAHLSYIFQLASLSSFVCDNTRPRHYPAAGGRSCAPVDFDCMILPCRLASVCKQWREIVHASPSLWSKILITMEDLNLPQSLLTIPPSVEGSPDAIPMNDECMGHLDRYLTFENAIEQQEGAEDWLNAAIPRVASARILPIIQNLVRHYRRWRSMTVLTDAWLPMRTVLEVLHDMTFWQFVPVEQSCSLESLVLMRCNPFVSHNYAFYPQQAMGPAYTPFKDWSEELLGSVQPSRLPFLQNLVLSGVHVDWDQLSILLSDSLRDLELSFHCGQVRPSPEQLRKILVSCRCLRRLVINGSGMKSNYVFNGNRLVTEDSGDRVYLNDLEELVIGFTDIPNALRLVYLVDAPRLQTLSLHDASDPACPDILDASTLLDYCRIGYVDSELTTGALEHVFGLSLNGTPYPNLRHVACHKLRCDPQSILHYYALGQVEVEVTDLIVLADTDFQLSTQGIESQAKLIMEGEDIDMAWEEEMAFQPGGTFNDLLFDARYGDLLHAAA